MICRDLAGYGGAWYLPQQLTAEAGHLKRAADGDVEHDTPYARILRLTGGPGAAPNPPRAIKLIRPRSRPRDDLRKYVACQARREFEAARRLQRWSIPSIAVHAWAVDLAPRAPYESPRVMDYRPGCENARRHLERGGPAWRQWALLAAIADDVATIYDPGFHYNDCHLGNVLVDAGGRHVWIDNERRPLSGRRDAQRRRRQSIDLLAASMKNAVPADMVAAFERRCAGEPIAFV